MKGSNLKVTKSNSESLIDAGKATQFGPDWPGKRCLAMTRAGTQCQKAALKGKDRCQLHGGRTPTRKEAPAQKTNYHTEIRKIRNWAIAAGYDLQF